MSAVDSYIERAPLTQRELIRTLVSVIHSAAADLTPSFKWGNLTYHHTANVCSIVLHQGHVNLQVWGGAGLADPQSLLHGTGKKMRHIRFSAVEVIDLPAVEAIIRQAAVAARL